MLKKHGLNCGNKLQTKGKNIMDLGAYSQIDTFKHIMVKNDISVPRLRGLRLMSEENPVPVEAIEEQAMKIGLFDCEQACESDFKYRPSCYTLDSHTDEIRHRYLVYNDSRPIDIRWNKVHGKKRKLFKYLLKAARKRVTENYSTFNKYCGRKDILYIHARIGGGNWPYYGGEVKNQPWFIEKVDDPFDSTYCDIYAIIK